MPLLPTDASVDAFARACAGLADVTVSFAPPSVSAFDDAELLAAQRTVAEIRRRADAAAAVIAAEVARRSRRELGDAGLARRLGARTPELLVARVAGTSAREAHSLVRVGSVMVPTSVESTEPMPWLAAVGAAVRAGELSVEAADSIRAGLGSPDESVSAQALAAATTELLRAAGSLTLERLAARAREERAVLDAAHVRDREQALRERRYLRITPQPDGMTRVSALLDPESAAIVIASYDAATSPRRGGPRFVDADEIARAERLQHDERTLDQLGVDAIVDLIRLGTAVDPGAIVGVRKPAVRVVVTEGELRRRHGHGHFEGHPEAISIETVERQICASGVVPILFDDDGHALNLGREQRRFSARQRIVLAVRDGGCRFPGCDRPPSWCEAHHIDEWVRDHGRTDIADGVLLCRHHHLLVHNNGWRVTREGADYALIPPRDVDLGQAPIPAPPRDVVTGHRSTRREPAAVGAGPGSS
ncbi:DUF222 domain-containing protein [Lysinimonas soli]|uniref:DUF222 domain-containing protein n=1 Tax=Lysinimonas soli TaxID=1074233 RepID=A0ABW0NS35_9MICO